MNRKTDSKAGNNFISFAKYPSLSFEVFPPSDKIDPQLNSITKTITRLVDYKPNFISVTCKDLSHCPNKRLQLAQTVKNLHIKPLAHLTCIGANKKEVETALDSLLMHDIQNILALRGDLPEETNNNAKGSFIYAKDLVDFIKSYGKFTVGAACYPEGHIENKNLKNNIDHLKQKVDAGVDFFISQFFFDNFAYYNFIDLMEKKGIKTVIIPGIMPIRKTKQLVKMVKLSGASIPLKVNRMLAKYQDDEQSLRKAGIEFARRQIADLIDNGSDGVHIYTMNSAKTARNILKGIEHLFPHNFPGISGNPEQK